MAMVNQHFQKGSQRERNMALDVARILAIFAVVLTHSSGGFVERYELFSSEFIWGNIFDAISRLGVPLFVMISGALMLDETRNITPKTLIFKTLKTTILLLFFWSSFYACIDDVMIPALSSKEIDIKEFFISVLQGPVHWWYMYMLVGLYCCIPFLRTFVKRENANLVLGFVAVSLAMQFTIPLLKAAGRFYGRFNYFAEFVQRISGTFFLGYTPYFLAGWYIVHVGIDKRWLRRILYGLGIMSLCITIVYVNFTKDYANAYENLNLLIFLYSVSVFVYINNEFKFCFGEKVKKGIVSLSTMSFGVYAIHMLFLNTIVYIAPYHSASGGNPVLYILGCAFLTLAVSFVWCCIVSKIPLVRKIVRM